MNERVHRGEKIAEGPNFVDRRLGNGDAHLVLEGDRDLRWRRGGHCVDRDQRQLDPQDWPLAAVVGQALDLAGQLHEQGHRNIADRIHVDDSDSADLQLAGDIGWRRGDQPVTVLADERPVVAHEVEAAIEQAKRKVRLSGS